MCVNVCQDGEPVPCIVLRTGKAERVPDWLQERNDVMGDLRRAYDGADNYDSNVGHTFPFSPPLGSSFHSSSFIRLDRFFYSFSLFLLVALSPLISSAPPSPSSFSPPVLFLHLRRVATKQAYSTMNRTQAAFHALPSDLINKLCRSKVTRLSVSHTAYFVHNCTDCRYVQVVPTNICFDHLAQSP